MSNTHTQIARKYRKSAYDLIRTEVPKGSIALIRSAADASGMSVNAFVNSALLSRLGLTEWPDAPTPVQNFDYKPVCSCIICGNPLPEGKMRYCSDECKREGHRRSAVESLRRKRLSQSQSPED